MYSTKKLTFNEISAKNFKKLCFMILIRWVTCNRTLHCVDSQESTQFFAKIFSTHPPTRQLHTNYFIKFLISLNF